MIKHLLALCLMLIGIGAQAFTPVNGKLYVLHNVKCDGYFSTTAVSVDGSMKTFSFQEKATPLTITSVGANTFTLQIPDGQYVNVSSANTWDVVATPEAYTWTISDTDGICYITDADGRQLGNSGNAGIGRGIFRGASSDHNAWRIEEYTAPEGSAYTISVTGLNADLKGGLIYGTTNYFHASTIETADELTTGVVTPINVVGYQASITLKEKTFTVAYRQNMVQDNPQAVCDLLNRIGGIGTSARFATRLDEALFQDGKDYFSISARDGKPYIQGSSIVAITTGINWYLNHYAYVNLSWNQLTADLSAVTLPVPETEETHVCAADYRYYLNYCTFGYSMTTWTWERWQQEIDWMALHGINMPLQIIGLEEVWRKVLVQYNYTDDEAKAFAAGPAFTAWWGMNNLEGWGGTTDNAWFARQAALAKKIGDRERELGMQPVLPGFAAIIPHDFTSKNPAYASESQGNWGGTFVRPWIMDPSGEKFPEVAARYYQALEEVMGTSKYYSMDPFHEGGSIRSGKYAEGYRAIYDAMNTCCGSDTKWVIQQWQWASYQGTSLTAVPAGRLIVLDLFSDGNPAFSSYKGYAPQDAVYCTIPNFGGRTGFMGRLPKMALNYFNFKKTYKNIKGIGTAPEAIESVPVVYDLLFELPWMETSPNTAAWVANYAKARYGAENADAAKAWETIRSTALNETTTLQGPHEAVMCGRPALEINAVSKWGGSNIFYDQQKFIGAAYDLLNAATAIGTSGNVGADNMSYDLTDIVRQVMSDYSKSLLASIKTASSNLSSDLFTARKDLFLSLLLDTDCLLGTNRMFRLGNWTETARKAAAEVEGATSATPDWYELNNARTLITTWGDKGASDWGLRDYSYRQWQGMLKDYYYPRWEYYFNHEAGKLSTPSAGWFYSEWNWAHELEGDWGANAKGTKLKTERTYYTAQPEGSTMEEAQRVLAKYILPVTQKSGSKYYCLRGTTNNISTKYTVIAEDGKQPLPEGVSEDEVVSLTVSSTNVATLLLTDGTEIKYRVDYSQTGIRNINVHANANAHDLLGRPFVSAPRQMVVISGGTKQLK